ncbi:MAG: hypothetical protein HYS98_05375 [Deltaproteobacteria bacterium]|nr:hypothetical protein [Deltaproteobacteria bacterium]
MRRPIYFLNVAIFACLFSFSFSYADNSNDELPIEDIITEKKIHEASPKTPLIKDYESYILLMTDSAPRSIQLDFLIDEYQRIKGEEDIRARIKVRLFEFGESFSDDKNRTVGNFVVFEIDSEKIVSFTLLSQDTITNWGIYNFINIPTSHLGFRLLKFAPDFEFKNEKTQRLLKQKRVDLYEIDLPTPFVDQKLTDSGSIRVLMEPRLTYGLGLRKNEPGAALQKRFYSKIKDSPDIYAQLFGASLNLLFLLDSENNAQKAWKIGASASAQFERAKEIHQRKEYDVGFVVATPEMQHESGAGVSLEFRYDYNDFNMQTYIGKDGQPGKHPRVFRLKDFSDNDHRVSFGLIFRF